MKFSILAAAWIVATAGAAAGATPVADATYYYHFENQNQMDGGPGSYSAAGASVSFGNTPSPSIRVTAGNTSVTAGMTYYVRIVGPDNVIVPISASGHLRVSSSAPDNGQANAGAQFSLTTNFNSPTAYIEHDAGGFNNGGLTSLDPVLHAFAYTNGDFAVHLFALVNARDGRDGPGSGTAFVDPVISIDPSFAAYDPDYLQHYFLQFSAGIGNSPMSVGGVPEPASWLLMIAGFGLVGGALRRRGAGPLLA